MKHLLAAVAVATLVGMPAAGSAATISGVLNTTGSATVTEDQIDFLPLGGTTGEFTVDKFAPGTGDFSGFNSEQGLIKDLMLPGDPVGVVFSKPDFMTFVNYPNLSFELTFIEPGVSGIAECFLAAAVGQQCTPAGSPFNLENTATGSTASFNVSGLVTDGNPGPASLFQGIFTTQFIGKSYQELLQTVFVDKESVTATYSAQFNVTAQTDVPEVPEPASMLLLGSCLFGFGLIAARRRKSS